jgi:branched-chain amino acid aminotransferase group I
MSVIICLNGSFVHAEDARISALDEGLLYGYGLFETILVRDGIPLLLEPHLRRMEEGARTIGIAMPFTVGEIGELVVETISRNGVGSGSVRITLFAGATPDVSNLVILTRPPRYGEEQKARGFRACIASSRRNEHSILSRVKSLNYLENILARREALSKGFDEAIFLNTSGYLSEGSATNVFLVKGGVLITPSEDQGILPGIMRELVIRVCKEHGIRVVERRVEVQELLRSDEAFLTNSLMEVMPLVQVEGHGIGSGKPGDLTMWLDMEVRSVVR